MKQRTKLYCNLRGEAITMSGMCFAEFMKYLPAPPERLMVISGGSGMISANSGIERCFEIFNTPELIGELEAENLYACGDFCFVDYADDKFPKRMSEKEIAELLYLGRMFRPLNSAFFDTLDNKLAYLSHDDGWYCKIYSRRTADILAAVLGKIAAYAGMHAKPGSAEFISALKHSAERGIIIDMNGLQKTPSGLSVDAYFAGEFDDMDEVLNKWDSLKGKSDCLRIEYDDGWHIMNA